MRHAMFLFAGFLTTNSLVLASGVHESDWHDSQVTKLRSAFLIRQSDTNPISAAQHVEMLQNHFATVLGHLVQHSDESIATAMMRLERHTDSYWSTRDRDQIEYHLRYERMRNIHRLKAYAQHGRFPQNEGHAQRAVPIFVDDHNTACAVGHLMRSSGWSAEVEEIRVRNNLVYVTDVTDGPLVEWVLRSGLTQEEAALIQPGYCSTTSLDYTSIDQAFNQQTLVVGDVVLSSIKIEFVDEVPEPSGDGSRWDWYREVLDSRDPSQISHPSPNALHVGTLPPDANGWLEGKVCARVSTSTWPAVYPTFVSLVEDELTSTFGLYKPKTLVPHESLADRLVRWEYDVQATDGRLLAYPTLSAFNALTTPPRSTLGLPFWPEEEDADMSIESTFSTPQGTIGSVQLSATENNLSGFQEFDLEGQQSIHVSTIVHARGTVYLNNITHEFHVVEPSQPRCDFDLSGMCDIADIDLLFREFFSSFDLRPPSFRFDLDDSGIVDLGDRDSLLGDIDTVVGDFNLDGKVDRTDLNILAMNWETRRQSYAQGDANGTFWVDARDLNELALNWQHGTDSAAAMNVVPESSGVSLVVSTFLGLCLFCRRKWRSE